MELPMETKFFLKYGVKIKKTKETSHHEGSLADVARENLHHTHKKTNLKKKTKSTSKIIKK